MVFLMTTTFGKLSLRSLRRSVHVLPLVRMVLVMLQVHLVVNGVPDTKDSNNESDKRLARGVLSVEPPSLDSTNCGLGR